MTAISPISGVDSIGLVTSITTTASNQETIEELRVRFLARLRLPPLGGAANDYLTWAFEVAGVTRAWVFPLYQGDGTVGLGFTTDNEDPIIPSAAKVSEVQAYIAERKPVTALFTAFAPASATMDLDISLNPNTVETRDNVTKELEDLIKRDATLAGSYKNPLEVNDGSILVSKIRQAISIAVGVNDYEINTINGVAPANVIPNQGEIIVLGGLSWQNLA